MKLEDYEKYYQKGGSYIIPVEIFNELFNDYECFKNDYQKYKEVLDKAIEYITSYESISTIQGLENADINKQFDEKTMTEMINRYLLVHDKLLQILEDKEVE